MMRLVLSFSLGVLVIWWQCLPEFVIILTFGHVTNSGVEQPDWSKFLSQDFFSFQGLLGVSLQHVWSSSGIQLISREQHQNKF